ncbi:Adenine/guanine permease AZG1 [Coccomyxa sp. Obi]|nr:Adenine/guanine permease AZG1 [Coccomyxa sp. Obi]
MGFLATVNEKFGASRVGRYFKTEERKTTLWQELRAGTVTFLTIAYILSVNANILSDTGGPCTSADCTGPDKSFSCRFTDPGYQACVDETRKSLITATAASSLLGCVIMGVAANMPVALAPGMGLNAYFTYNVVGFYGTKNVSYQEALAAIFIEGWIFVIISAIGVRQKIIGMLPRTLALAMAAGIGLFLAHIGYQGSQGIGLVVGDGATLVTLGGCSVESQVHPYYIADTTGICTPVPNGPPPPNLPPEGPNYECPTWKLNSGPLWMGLGCLAIMSILMSRNFKGAIIVGIAVTTIISWIPGHAASYLGPSSTILGGIGGDGESRWEYFRNVVAVPSIKKTGGALSFSNFASGDLWLALITFLYVDFFDATGTLFSMANFINNFIPGFVDPKTNNFPGSTLAYCSDGLSIVIGSLMGTSPVTVFVESATGIREGGRTGLTALMVAFWMFVALWFTPIIASIPTYCTGPALILTGALMMINVVKIDWNDINKAVPAFLTISIMPLTYSISYGVIGGVVSFILLHAIKWVCDKLSDRTNGAFGYCTPPQAPEGAHAPAAKQPEEYSVGGKPSDNSVSNGEAAASEATEKANPVLPLSKPGESIV